MTISISVQKLFLALMAITSLLIVQPEPLHAQIEGKGQTVEPGKGQHTMDEPVDAVKNNSNSGSDSVDVLRVSAGKTVDSIEVSGKKVIVSGHVKHNITARDCELIFEKSAVVGGTVHATNCEVTNNASSAIKLIVSSRKPSSGTDDSDNTESAPVANMEVPREVAAKTNRKKAEPGWFGAQFALMLLGLMGAGFSLIAVPNASKRVTEHIATQPKKDLRMGALLGLGLLGLLAADAVLLHTHTVLSYLWAPVGITIFFAPLLALGFGWIAAMRFAGDAVAKKFNQPGEGSMFGRTALGLFAFFVLNVFLGTISRTLGVIGLCAEFSVALMGLGAAALVAVGGGYSRRV